ERNLSMSIQAIAAGLFVLHAIYAVILFFLGNREKQMLYFPIVLLSLSFLILASTDEKVIHLFIDIPYKWDFSLSIGLGLISGFALLHSFDHKWIPYWRLINPILTVMFVSVTLTVFLSSPPKVI